MSRAPRPLRSSTITPSYRKSTRDAAAATVGSWVTTTTVLPSAGSAAKCSSTSRRDALSSISSKALLTGKIIGNSAAALAQILAIAATVLGGLAINGSVLPVADLVWPIVWFVVLFLFGFVMIAALYAAAAALVSRTEDLNTALQPLSWLVMLPYLGVAVGTSNPLAMTVMSYIPFSAPVAVPVRIFLGQSAGWEPFASLALLVLTTVATVWFAARIYDRGLLRTGKPMKWREAIAAAS